MAGHSKWANIKHRKQSTDAKKSSVFTKISREIFVLAKKEKNPELNPKLRKAIEKAKVAGMGKDKIQNAIKKSSLAFVNKENWESIVYEACGPFCSAFIISAITNNKNRTASELRLIFSRANGNLGRSGSVQWMFERFSLFSLDLDFLEKKITPEKLIEEILGNLGLEDFDFLVDSKEKNSLEIFANYSDYQKIFEFLEKLNLDFNAETSYLPREPIKIESQEQIKQLEKLVGKLEENDDIQKLDYNFVFGADKFTSSPQ